MATAAAMITDVRSRIVEDTADFFTDVEILRWLNQGYKRFISLTEWAERVIAYRVVANQFEYDLGTDTIKVGDVRWQDQYKVWPKDQEEFHGIIGPASATVSSRPYIYKLFPWDGKIRIHPKPSASSASTQLNGAILSTDVTITVDSTTGFPSYGRIIIGSEQVLYTAITATTFTGCVRGDGRTTAASALDNAVVYHAPLEVYQVYMPADLATSPATGTITSPNYDEAIINYACHIAMLKREKYTESQLFRKLFDDVTQTAIEERRRMTRDRLHVIKDEDSFGDMRIY